MSVSCQRQSSPKRLATPTNAIDTVHRSVAACSNPAWHQLATSVRVSHPHDPAEREADHVANIVTQGELAPSLGMAGDGATVHRMCPQCEGEQKQEVQAKREPGAPEFSTGNAGDLNGLEGRGHAMPSTLRGEFEPRFGRDFSDVRLHTDSQAADSAHAFDATAYTYGRHIVFGAGQFDPASISGRRLIAHELTHVVQQSGSERAGVQGKWNDRPAITSVSQAKVSRQPKGAGQASPTTDMMRIYSFGPSGAGRMQMDSGMTIFPPAAPVDANGNELVRAGTPAQPKLARFGRYFTLDERERPYPPPVPTCAVKVLTEWKPDDGSAVTKDQHEDKAARYYQPGEPLGTNLGTEYIFSNDRPGVLTLAYVFTNPNADFLLLAHGVHFVNDPAAPPGATVLPENERGQGSTAASQPGAKAGTNAPAATASAPPEKKPDAKATPQPTSTTPRNVPAEKVNQVNVLTEEIKKTADAATRDPLVRKLRDVLSELQPFMPAKDAQKQIDDAIRSLVTDGIDEGIKAILKAVTGKSPTAMPENRNQYGPYVPQRDLGEHIFQGPKITINDVPKRAPRIFFEYRNGPHKSYEPGAAIRFTLIPPENFDTLQGAKRLVIVKEADRNTPNPDRLARVLLESGSPTPIELVAPQEPGKYVIRVDIGLGFDDSNMQEFEVIAPQKK